MFYTSRRAARNVLLASVSAAALVLTAPSDAAAQNATPAWWASVEGQYNWVDGDAFDFYGESFSPKNGWAGKLHLGGRIGGDWSAAVGVRYGKTDKESESTGYFISNYSNFEAGGDYKEEHLVIDLEIGRDVGIGNGGNARIFGGLRFARFDGDGDFNSHYSSFDDGIEQNLDVSTKQRFTGIGPRVGVDAAIPVAGNLRADLGVAGAVMYGKRKLKVNASYSSFCGACEESETSEEFSDTEKKNVLIPSLEASVALTYLLGSNASISAGYKAEQFWNIMPTFDQSGATGNDDRLIHGPFLKLTITGN